MELELKVSENLSRSDQRDFLKNFLFRTTPGLQFAFIKNGRLRKGVRLQRSSRKLKAIV